MRTTLSLAALASVVLACDPSSLDNSTYLYDITTYGTTIADVANATDRGLCDIGRANLMADVLIIPNVGQQILIPPQTCTPDSTTCLVNQTAYGTCISGGPRLYYTVNGDTYERIAARLGLSTYALTGSNTTNTTELLPVGEFVKVPLCSPSQCVMQPYHFTYGVYKDLAEEFNTTVGQIMMLSPTYNYSTYSYDNRTSPTIDLPINCTVLSSDYTVLT